MDFSGRCVPFISETEVERWLTSEGPVMRKRFSLELQHDWSDAVPAKHRRCWQHPDTSALAEHAFLWECPQCYANLSQGQLTARATIVCSRCKLSLFIPEKAKLA